MFGARITTPVREYLSAEGVTAPVITGIATVEIDLDRCCRMSSPPVRYALE